MGIVSGIVVIVAIVIVVFFLIVIISIGIDLPYNPNCSLKLLNEKWYRYDRFESRGGPADEKREFGLFVYIRS